MTLHIYNIYKSNNSTHLHFIENRLLLRGRSAGFVTGSRAA